MDLVEANTSLEASDTATIAAETTYELGYKGEFKRFKVGVDVYRQTKRIFLLLKSSVLLLHFPHLLQQSAMDYSFVFSRALGSFLAQLLGDIMGDALLKDT